MAPLATVVPPSVVPNPVALVTSSVPALTVVVPVYVLAPLKVSVPAPVLVTAPVPEMTPDKLAALVVLLVKVPLSAIASAPTAARRFNVAPLATVVPPSVVPNPVALKTPSVPALTVVVPLYVLAPLKFRIPAPVLVTVPVPEMTPVKVAFPVVELVKVPLSAIASAPTDALMSNVAPEATVVPPSV